jgi:curved DNA-binding protein
MNFKDYYKILDVAPNATDQEIKQVYRRLVRMHHPDVNQGDPEAEERFKNIGEAYHVLGNGERRNRYDQMRQHYSQWREHPGTHRSGFTVNGVVSDIFGFNLFSNFFNAVFQSSNQEGPSRYQQPQPAPQPGKDKKVVVDVSLEEAWHGTEHVVEIGTQRLRVVIPPGVGDGTELLIEGRGNPGTMGATAGNLYLVVKIKPHPRFVREENDLYTELPVDIFTAILGGEVMLPTIDGYAYLTLPPETQADRIFNLIGYGMPLLNNSDDYGDLYIRIKLVFPDSLNPAELKTLRKLATKHHSRNVS